MPGGGEEEERQRRRGKILRGCLEKVQGRYGFEKV